MQCTAGRACDHGSEQEQRRETLERYTCTAVQVYLPRLACYCGRQKRWTSTTKGIYRTARGTVLVLQVNVVDPPTPSGAEQPNPGAREGTADGEGGEQGGAAAAENPEAQEVGPVIEGGIVIAAKPEDEEPEWAPNCVVQFTFEDGLPDDLKYFDLKNAFGGKEGGVVYVEHSQVWPQQVCGLSPHICKEEAEAESTFVRPEA